MSVVEDRFELVMLHLKHCCRAMRGLTEGCEDLAAVYFVGSSSGFSEALERSVVFAGPANYCPVLVGAIGGARWGSSAIPAPALAHVDILRRVETCAHGLAAGWAKA